MKLQYITFNIPVQLENLHSLFESDSKYINQLETNFKTKIYDKLGYFNIHGIINLETGQVLDWETTDAPIEIFAKVCDEGFYAIFDTEFNEFGQYEGYVPKIFEVNERGYGDYFNMTINEKGMILNWDKDINSKIKSFLKNLKE